MQLAEIELGVSSRPAAGDGMCNMNMQLVIFNYVELRLSSKQSLAIYCLTNSCNLNELFCRVCILVIPLELSEGYNVR